jgi:hypothetical protein
MAPITAIDLRTARLPEWFTSLSLFESGASMQGLERERPPLLAIEPKAGAFSEGP